MVNIPAPERYAVHKFIVYGERPVAPAPSHTHPRSTTHSPSTSTSILVRKKQSSASRGLVARSEVFARRVAAQNTATHVNAMRAREQAVEAVCKYVVLTRQAPTSTGMLQEKKLQLSNFLWIMGP
jgi:hypothetical protein